MATRSTRTASRTWTERNRSSNVRNANECTGKKPERNRSGVTWTSEKTGRVWPDTTAAAQSRFITISDLEFKDRNIRILANLTTRSDSRAWPTCRTTKRGKKFRNFCRKPLTGDSFSRWEKKFVFNSTFPIPIQVFIRNLYCNKNPNYPAEFILIYSNQILTVINIFNDFNWF